MTLQIDDRKIAYKESELWSLNEMVREDFPFIGGVECAQKRVRGVPGDRVEKNYLVVKLATMEVQKPK